MRQAELASREKTQQMEARRKELEDKIQELQRVAEAAASATAMSVQYKLFDADLW